MIVMGADRYSVCPRCQHEHDAAIAAEETRVGAMYGVVPVAEFDEARLNLATAKEQYLAATFREDWEIGEPHTDGVMDFYYKGNCGICDLSIKAEEHYTVWSKP